MCPDGGQWYRKAVALAVLRGMLTCVLVGLVLLAFVRFAPFVWYSPQIRARVVTPWGKPVEGAVVVASWNIEGSINARSLGQLALSEVTTDRDGWFVIPAWGPRFAFVGTVFETEPIVRVFHPDFAPLIIANAPVGMRPANPILRFRYQGQSITLPVWPRSIEERKAALEELMQSLMWILQMPRLEGRCPPQLIPGLMQVMLQAKRQLDPGRADLLLASIEQFDPRELANRLPCD